MLGSSILRFEVALSLLAVVTLTACGVAVPPGAYQPESGSAQYFTIGRSLTRAAIAAGENPENYKFGFIRSSEINAANSGAGTFYFTDGLAAQPQEVIDAVVAHEVAHEVLGHVGRAILTRLAISTAFAVAGIFVPGLQYADYAVNPLVANAFDRPQEIEADQKAVQILGKMGYSAPEQVMLAVLTKLRSLYGAVGGGLLDTHPNIDDRIAEIAKLQRTPIDLGSESQIAGGAIKEASRMPLPYQDLRVKRDRGASLTTRDEWEAFFTRTGQREDKPVKFPNTWRLRTLARSSLISCHTEERLFVSIVGGARKEEMEAQVDSTLACVRGAEKVFLGFFERARTELSDKPNALIRLEAFGATWLSAIRQIPRAMSAERTLGPLQLRDRKLIEETAGELDIELF